MKKNVKFDTRCVSPIKVEGQDHPHILPINATSSYNFQNVEDSIDVFTGQREGFVYSRYANPTVKAVEGKLAELEGFDTDFEVRALMTSSGMSAIHTLMTALLSPGDIVLTQGNLYGGTTELLTNIFQKFSVNVRFENFSDLNSISDILEKEKSVRLIYLETPANPTLDCVDIRAVAGLANYFGVASCIDNTFATPYLQRPLEMGIDYVIHSTTKYLNGHGNGIAGAILAKESDEAWPQIWSSMKLMGTNANPFDAWLVYQGMRTLPLRMTKQCDNALALAQYLDGHANVERVNYPGLANHPSYEIAKKQMAQFGAMMSFAVKGGQSEALKVINQLELSTIAPTLGDIDTLVLHPATSSHLNVDKALCEAYGITDNLIRVSVGIEDIQDLISDFQNALDGLS